MRNRMRPTRRSGLRGIAACLVLALGSLGWADAPLSAAVPGATGIARTAGPGGAIETFPITILGVLDDAGNGFPLVLVRASGPFIERSGGVAAGMSGSPVYLDVDGAQELLGAIGHVFPESDHALALVTPIAAMRRWALDDDPAAFGPGLGTGWAVAATHPGTALGPIEVGGLGVAVPVATPVLVAGIGGRAQRFLAPAFGPEMPLVSAQGGVASSRDGVFHLEPGAAISVLLARGDVTIGAIGTLTTFERGRVLAFGHALLGRGDTALPFAPAYVQAIVASSVVPFKLANSGSEILGTFTQDRPAGLAGRAGAIPDLLPATVVLGGVGRGESLSFEVVRDPALAPALIATAVLEGIDRSLQAAGGGSARLSWEIHLEEGPPIRILDHVADERDVALEAARAIFRPLDVLADNPFAEPGIRRIAVNIDLTWSLETADIVEVRSETGAVGPGDEATVHVRLQPYRSEPRVETFLVELPLDLPEDEVRLRIRGGRVVVDDPDDDGEPPLLSFAELVSALEDRPNGDELVIELVMEDRVVRLAQRTFPFVVRGSEDIVLDRIEPGDAGPERPTEAPAPPGDGTEGADDDGG